MKSEHENNMEQALILLKEMAEALEENEKIYLENRSCSAAKEQLMKEHYQKTLDVLQKFRDWI